MEAMKKRNRRSPEERIKELESKIAQVKARAERAKVAKDPALRHVKAALKGIDKALNATQDGAMRAALDEARTTLGACLTLHGEESKGARGTLVPQPRNQAKVELETLLNFLVKHPGSRSEGIAAALRTDTRALRPALQQLRAEGRARTEGQGRATRYYVDSEA
jgi:hypothetical protein